MLFRSEDIVFATGDTFRPFLDFHEQLDRDGTLFDRYIFITSVDDDGNGTGRYLYLQLKAGPSHLRRSREGREIFRIKKPRHIQTWTQQPYPVMLVIGREVDPMAWDRVSWDRLVEVNLTDPEWRDPELKRRHLHLSAPFGSSSRETRAFPDVRWMEITSVLKRELASGRQPEEIKQIEFVGETLDLASVLRWRDRLREGYRG